MPSLATASRNLRDTLAIALTHTDERAALVISDDRTELSRLLARAYAATLPKARFVVLDETDEASVSAVHAALVDLREHDLVVLIQSTTFRIPEMRLRVELFRRGIKVVEHAHLGRITSAEIETYVDALAYDPTYYRGVGHALKARMDVARSARIESKGETLYVDSALEPAKLNIGQFDGMKNVGGLFPIGEVFTEARNLESVHGRVTLFAFTDTSFALNVPAEPVTLEIEKGRVVRAPRSTPELDRVLAMIREDEGDVRVRELGFGLNRAFSRERRVSDVGAYERVCGIHLSLGSRHGVYKKPEIDHRAVHFHVDSFVVTDRVLLDDQVVYQDGAWRVSEASLASVAPLESSDA
jgi:hypothetical protein